MDRETPESSSTCKETVCTDNPVRSLRRNTCSALSGENPPHPPSPQNGCIIKYIFSSAVFSETTPPCFGSVCCLRPLLGGLGDVDAVEVVGAEGTVALGALPLSGVVTHLETLVAEHVETLGEHRLLVSGVAAGAAQLGLRTQTCTSQTMTDRFFFFFSPTFSI